MLHCLWSKIRDKIKRFSNTVNTVCRDSRQYQVSIVFTWLYYSIKIECLRKSHTLSVEAFLTLRTLTPLGRWNSWFSKSVLKNVVCVRGSVKDMPTSLTIEVLSFSTLSLVVPCWNTTCKKTHKRDVKCLWVFKKLSFQCWRTLHWVLTGLLLPTMTRSWSLRPPIVLLCSGWTMPMSAFCLKRSSPLSWNSILSHPFGPMRITVHITSVIWGRCSQRQGLVIAHVNSLPSSSGKSLKKKDVWTCTFWLTMRLIKARRKRRTMMKTAMFPFRPLSPVLWRRSSSIGTYPALKLLLCSLLILRLSNAFSLMDFFTGPLELSWNRRSFMWHYIFGNLIITVRNYTFYIKLHTLHIFVHYFRSLVTPSTQTG